MIKLKTRRADLDAVIDEAAADDSVDCDTAEPVADDITDADTDQDDVLPTADDDSDAAGVQEVTVQPRSRRLRVRSAESTGPAYSHMGCCQA